MTAVMHKISTAKAMRISRVEKPFDKQRTSPFLFLPVNCACIVYYYIGRFCAVSYVDGITSCISRQLFKSDSWKSDGYVGIGRNGFRESSSASIPKENVIRSNVTHSVF